MRFHNLWYTFMSLAVLSGVHSKITSEMLGHLSVAFTLIDTYSHLILMLQQAATRRPKEMLGSKLRESLNVSKMLAPEKTGAGPARYAY